MAAVFSVLVVFPAHFNGSSNTYAKCLGNMTYGFTSSLTCKERVPLKHPIPVNTLLYTPCISLFFLHLSLCQCLCLDLKKVVYFLFGSVVSVQIIFKTITSFGLIFFVCSLICLPFC